MVYDTDQGYVRTDWNWGFDKFAVTLKLESVDPIDLNTDGSVDIADITFFLARWLDIDCQEPGWCNGCDFSEDTKVNLEDFKIFTQHW